MHGPDCQSRSMTTITRMAMATIAPIETLSPRDTETRPATILFAAAVACKFKKCRPERQTPRNREGLDAVTGFILRALIAALGLWLATEWVNGVPYRQRRHHW